MTAAQRLLAACLGALAMASSHAAAPIALPSAPAVRFEPEVGASLPLHVAMKTSKGEATTLGRYFDGRRAVVLVPGYYTCTQLCGLVMHGVLEALGQSGVAPSTWRVVGFSIDPSDTTSAARQREADDLAYARFLASNGMWRAEAPPALDLLTLDETAVTTLKQVLRIDALRAADSSIDHAAGFIIATPDGRVTRHFSGVRFAPRDLRLALIEASQGRVGTVSDQWVLLCSHFDPSVGRHTGSLMLALRVFGILGLLAGGTWLWRRRRTSGDAA